MTTPAEYLALAGRCEAGESGPLIDADILDAVRWPMPELPPVTTSLDASEALRQRLLPEWAPSHLCHMANGDVQFALSDDDGGITIDTTAPTELAARNSALLRALAATQGDDNAG